MSKKVLIQIVTPEFQRPTGTPGPASPPADLAAWKALQRMDNNALRELGLRSWNDPDSTDRDDVVFGGRTLWLLPAEWYQHIPDGFELTTIRGGKLTFALGVADNDMRHGCLPYGILATKRKRGS